MEVGFKPVELLAVLPGLALVVIISIDRISIVNHDADDNGWGRYVVVDHGTYQTRYTHLHSISVNNGGYVTTALGVSGSSGNSTGPHLHFGLGIPDVSPLNTVNPILKGLKQPFYGELNIIEDKASNLKIKLLATGPAGTFKGENEPLQVVKPGEPLRAIIEAYHRANLASNPFAASFILQMPRQ